jgi:glucose-6-phosphate 1-dehydrogenase
VSLTLFSHDPKWAGVPIVLTTGKALAEKFTGIKISYKKDRDTEANELILKLQPDEGVELGLWTKSPGYKYAVTKKSLHFNFSEHYSKLPEAYEQVLFNAINSDHSLFTSGDEVLETWRILNLIQKSWEMSSDDLIYYEPGSSISSILSLY